MSDQWYYEFMHPDHALRMKNLLDSMALPDLRFVDDIIGTASSMFRYENLPEGLTSNILEAALMFRNKLCFVYSYGLGKHVLGYYVPVGEWDEYYQPTKVEVFTLYGKRSLGVYEWKEIILAKDNPLDIPKIMPILTYLEKIIELEDDVMILSEHASLPLVLTGNKRQATALKQQAKQFGHRHSFIIGDDTIAENVQSYDIKLTINPLDIYDLKNKYKNECLTSLGIYSVEQKRERIVTQELVNQNDYSDFIYWKRLNSRKLMVELLNAAGENVVLYETYEENYQSSVEELKDTSRAKLLGQAEAIKEVDPNATFDQSNPVKIMKG